MSVALGSSSTRNGLTTARKEGVEINSHSIRGEQ